MFFKKIMDLFLGTDEPKEGTFASPCENTKGGVYQAPDKNPDETVYHHAPTDSLENNDKMKVYHLIVLDESGSMRCVTHQTISGCNETIQTIRQMQAENEDTQEHFVSIYLFSTGNSRYIIYNEPIYEVKVITGEDYDPHACTPMLDALGRTLNDMDEIISQPNVMGYVTIITDGMENDSKKYTLKEVKALIGRLKEKNVVFSFVGANIDAAEYATHLNIDNWMQFEQDEDGTRNMWNVERRSKLRSNAKMAFMREFGTSDEKMNFTHQENSGSYYHHEVPIERVAPARIDTLKENEVFVFGSNKDGLHRSGAAKKALMDFGAKEGQGEGMQGQSYAIPTVGVSKGEMYEAIRRFCIYASKHPELVFYVTPVGCGIAGYRPSVVAPMFKDAVNLPNVKLPFSFWEYNTIEH